MSHPGLTLRMEEVTRTVRPATATMIEHRYGTDVLLAPSTGDGVPDQD